MTDKTIHNPLAVKDITNVGVEVNPVENLSWAVDEVSPGKRVSLHFSLSLVNSEGIESAIIDSNFNQSPASFVFGDGSLLPGFERAIVGLKAGDEGAFTIKSENAFGLVNEDNVQGFPPYQFPADLILEEGLMINFTDVAGNAQAGVVKEFDAKKVVIDFNHPLAGKPIEFKVKIVTVENLS